MIENNRCTRIAELLLIENEVKKLESASTGISIIQSANGTFDFYQNDYYSGREISPIECIMLAILERIETTIRLSFDGYYHFYFFPQYKIGKYIVDFLVGYDNEGLEQKVVIECDGHDFHEKTKEQVAYDKKRERFLTSNGYIVLRYSSGAAVFLQKRQPPGFFFLSFYNSKESL